MKVYLCGAMADTQNLLGGWAADGDVGECQTLREALSARVTLCEKAEDAEVVLMAAGEPQ